MSESTPPHKPQKAPLDQEVRAALSEMAQEAPAPPSAEAVLARLREPRVIRPRARSLRAAAAAVALSAAAVTLAVVGLEHGDRSAQPVLDSVGTAVNAPHKVQPEERVTPEEATREKPQDPERLDLPATAHVEPIAPDAPSIHAMGVLTQWIESTGASGAVIDARPGRPVALALRAAVPNPERDYDSEVRTLLAHYNVVELRYEAGSLTGTLGRVRTKPQP